MTALSRPAPVSVSGERLTADLAAVNRFGATAAGGAERVAWTEPDLAARTWLAETCRELGLVVEHDEAGSVWALPSEAPNGPGSLVLMGSHLDTVPDGGRFDGAVGVTGALEVLRAALEAGVPEARRLGLVCWSDEEGARFGMGMLGSRSVAGFVTPAELEQAVDNDGVRLVDVLARSGLDPARVPEAARRRAQIAAYLELHIEQGPALDRAGLPVGIVTGIVGVSNWRFTVEGVANHAGSTMPADRHDALIPVAAIALAAQSTMHAQHGLVATVGEATVVGGASNIVPGLARCTLDARSLDPGLLDAGVAAILEAGRRSAADNGCTLHAYETKRMPPAIVPPEMLERLDAAARAEGLDPPRMPSRAAHDGQNLAAAGVPIGMIFVRSLAGISHAPQERSTDEDIAAGARVLARAALDLARTLDATGALSDLGGAGAWGGATTGSGA
ncbi:MAG TPA: Zn-dependent hydrolase [Candidatus Binatia bacterium]|nr:Zn-dependent hydrolase [Candidatus Binatia bacterium]